MAKKLICESCRGEYHGPFKPTTDNSIYCNHNRTYTNIIEVEA